MSTRRTERAKVGASIAAFNSSAELRECLRSGEGQWDHVVVVDDGSSDDTAEMLDVEFPKVAVIRGGGSLWWAEATNSGVRACLSAGCNFVLLVNPDVILAPGAVECLLEVSQGRAVVAALVLDADDPGRVWWGGSIWGRVHPALPVFASRYILRRGCEVLEVGERPYRTDEVHGRAVLFPAWVFERHGFLDSRAFPQYGGDVDFSCRLRAAGVTMLVAPRARVRLRASHSAQAIRERGLLKRVNHAWRYLTNRRGGEGLRTWWIIMRRHVPAWAVVPSYLFVVGLNLLRRLQPYRSGRSHS